MDSLSLASIQLNSVADSQCDSKDTYTFDDCETECSCYDLVTLASDVEISSILLSLIVKYSNESNKNTGPLWRKFIQNLNKKITLKNNKTLFYLFSAWCIKHKRQDSDENAADVFLRDLYHFFNQSIKSRPNKRSRSS